MTQPEAADWRETTVLAYLDEPPFGWDDDGTPRGADIELAAWVLDRLRVRQVVYRKVLFAELLSGVERGAWHVNVPMFVTGPTGRNGWPTPARPSAIERWSGPSRRRNSSPSTTRRCPSPTRCVLVLQTQRRLGKRVRHAASFVPRDRRTPAPRGTVWLHRERHRSCLDAPAIGRAPRTKAAASTGCDGTRADLVGIGVVQSMPCGLVLACSINHLRKWATSGRS